PVGWSRPALPAASPRWSRSRRGPAAAAAPPSPSPAPRRAARSPPRRRDASARRRSRRRAARESPAQPIGAHSRVPNEYRGLGEPQFLLPRGPVVWSSPHPSSPRSSGDRAPPSGGGSLGSNPSGGALLIAAVRPRRDRRPPAA